MTEQSQTELGDESKRDALAPHRAVGPPEPTIPDSQIALEQLDLHPLKQIGDYRLCREIGRGGMGVVYEALELSLQRKVALKILPVTAHLDPMLAKRFNNESRAAAQLSHPNIIPVYAVGSSDGVNYFAMQLVDGRNLNQLIKAIRSEFVELSTLEQGADVTVNDSQFSGKRSRRQAKPKSSQGTDAKLSHGDRVELSASDFAARSDRHSSTLRAHAVARLGANVASALQHAHDMGVIHRDIKPSNLILDNQGKVWVTDFGLALVKNTPSLTRTGVLLGTLRYMSPEQATGVRALVDHRTDIYSLGVTLCELLTLRRVVVGKTTEEILKQIIYDAPVRVQRLDPAIPEDMAVILEKAMAKNPLERYTTAGEMAEDLNRFLRNEAIKAKRPSLLKRSQRWLGRHKPLASMLGATLAFIFVTSIVATGAIWRSLQAEMVQRERAETALTVSEALRLQAIAALELPTDPGLSLVLGLKGETGFPGLDANRIVQAALDESNEYAAVMPRDLVSTHVTISPDAQTVITCVSSEVRDEGTYPAILQSMTDGRDLGKLDSGDCITSAAFSPAGNFIVTASKAFAGADGKAALSRSPVLWQASTGRKARVFTDATLIQAHPAIFDREGERIVLGQGNEARVYRLAGGQAEIRLRGHSRPVVYAEFSPDGKRILTVSEDSTIRVWDSQTGRELRPPITRKLNPAQRITANFVASSDALVVGGSNPIELYPAVTLADASTSPLAAASLFQVVASRAMDQVASSQGNDVIILSAKNLKQICKLNLPSRATGIRFHPTDAVVLVLCGKQMFLYNSETGQLLSELRGHRFSVTDACFALSSDRLASVSTDRTLRLWHAESGLARRTFRPPPDVYQAPRPHWITLSPDDKLLAVCSRSDFVTSVHDANGKKVAGDSLGMVGGNRGDSERLVLVRGKTVAVSESSTSRDIYRGTFAEDLTVETKLIDRGRQLLVHTLGLQAFLVDLHSGVRRRLGDVGERIGTVAVAPDSSFAVLATDAGRYFAIDAATGNVLWSKRHDLQIVDIDISPDQQKLALVDTAGNVEVWMIDGQEALGRIKESERPVDRVKFGLDGQRLVTWHALENQTIRCHEVEDLESYSEYAAEGIVRLDAHPTQPLLAIATSQQALLWNCLDESVEPLAEQACRSIRFSEDRVAMLLSRDADQPAALQIYSLSERELLYEEDLDLAPVSVVADLQRNQFLVTQQGYAADVFNFETGELAHVSRPHATAITFAGFSAALPGLVTVSEDGVILLSDETGNAVRRMSVPGRAITAAAMDEEGEVLLTGSESGEVTLWSIEHGTSDTLEGHQAPIRSIRIDQSGTSAVTVASGEPVRYWDLRTHSATEIEIADALHAELSGKSLLVIAGDARLNARKAWLLADAQSKPIDVTQPQGTTMGLFSPDGKHIGLLAPNGKLDIKRVENQKTECSLSEDSEHIVGFAFAPDGKKLLTAQSTVCSVWSLDTCTKKVEASYSKDRIALNDNWRPFSHDAKWFVTSRPEVRKRPCDPVELAKQSIHRELSDEEQERFHLELGETLKQSD